MIVTNEVMTNHGVVTPSSAKAKWSNLVLWSSFATTTVLFRMHSWVIICSFLGEFSLPIVVGLFVLCTGVILQHRLKGVEPLTFSLYCLAFPMACVHSTTQYAKEKLDLLNRKVVWALSLVGTLVILLSVWLVYIIVQFSLLGYSSSMRIRRDAVTCHIVGASVTGIFTLVMAKFLTLQAPGEATKKIFPLFVVPAISVFLTCLSIAWYIYLVILGTGSETLTMAEVRTVCGKPLNTPITLEGYTRNGDGTQELSNFELFKHEPVKTAHGQELLGKLGGYYLLVDGIPAKPLMTQSLKDKPLYMIFHERQIEMLNNSMQDNCIPG